MIRVKDQDIYISEDNEELATDLALLLLFMRQKRPRALLAGLSTYAAVNDKEYEFKYRKVKE